MPDVLDLRVVRRIQMPQQVCGLPHVGDKRVVEHHASDLPSRSAILATTSCARYHTSRIAFSIHARYEMSSSLSASLLCLLRWQPLEVHALRYGAELEVQREQLLKFVWSRIVRDDERTAEVTLCLHQQLRISHAQLRELACIVCLAWPISVMYSMNNVLGNSLGPSRLPVSSMPVVDHGQSHLVMPRASRV